jgi:hypothetical protein
VLVLDLIDQAAAVERLRVVGIERERGIEFRQRLVVLAGSCQNLAAGGVALCVADVLLTDRIRRFFGGGLRFVIVRTPRSQIERTAGQRDAERDRKPNGWRGEPAQTRNSGDERGDWKNHTENARAGNCVLVARGPAKCIGQNAKRGP